MHRRSEIVREITRGNPPLFGDHCFDLFQCIVIWMGADDACREVQGLDRVCMCTCVCVYVCVCVCACEYMRRLLRQLGLF